MSIFPEILVGADVARDLVTKHFPDKRVAVRGDEPTLREHPSSILGMVAEMHVDQYAVVCMALQGGINVCAHGKFGFSLASWGESNFPGYTMVKYPSSPLTEDQAGFRAALAGVLVPVVESALAAVQAERDAVTTGGER